MDRIKELYYGKTNPNENRISRSKKHEKAIRKFCEYEKALSEKLSGEELLIWKRLSDASDEMMTYTEEESFKTGFVLGVELMAACFCGMGE